MDQTRRGLVGAMTVLAASGGFAERLSAKVPAMAVHPMVARVWHGRTSLEKAEEYRQYLFEEGVKQIASLPGNRGVQMMVAKTADQGEFMIVSYWASVDAIKSYAGADYTRVHDLPRDKDFLIDRDTLVHHFDVDVNLWQSSHPSNL
jgi:heme-degrading monooxygenase HmoA